MKYEKKPLLFSEQVDLLLKRGLEGVPIPNNRVFGILTLCRYCLSQIAPQSRWPIHVTQLLADFPTVSIKQMGFPINWINSPLWK
jgi:hypothetical protein